MCDEAATRREWPLVMDLRLSRQLTSSQVRPGSMHSGSQLLARDDEAPDACLSRSLFVARMAHIYTGLVVRRTR